MKNLIFLSLFFALPCFAAKKKKDFLIATELNYKTPQTTAHSKSENILEGDDFDSWQPLNQAENGVVLLGRMISEKENYLQFEFMIVDTNQKPIFLDGGVGMEDLSGAESVIRHSRKDKSGNPLFSSEIKVSIKKVDHKEKKQE